MKRIILFISSIIFLFALSPPIQAQTNQTVTNGNVTTPLTFPNNGCTFNWVNDTPGIGLPASGSGSIPSFTATNTGTGTVTATITATPASNGFAYIINGGNNLSIVNCVNNTVIKTIQIGAFPSGITVNPDGSRVYVVDAFDNTVSVVSTSTNTVIATIPVGLYPTEAWISPDGGRLYVSNTEDNTISVINTGTNKVVSNILVSSSPIGLCISTDGSKLYVASSNTNTVTVYNLTNNQVVKVIATGDDPTQLTISPDGSKLYVLNTHSNSVSVINTASYAVVATITVGQNPEGISISPDGSAIYVANSYSNNLSVINTANNTVTATITAGNEPDGVSVTSDGDELFVTNNLATYVSVINTSTNAVAFTIPIGSSSNSIGKFITPGIVGCSVIKATITVNPSTVTAIITAGAVAGGISACVGSASVSPGIARFTVSGNGLTGNITAAAPADFEVSLNSKSGYGSSVILNQTAGVVNNTVIYVRLAASAPLGKIAGNVTLTSAGIAAQNVAVAGIVNALPTINAISNQNIANGKATLAVSFTGSANTFTWVNDTPGIGLAANGNGNISSFTAVNTGSTPITATITATPIVAGLAYLPNSNGTIVSVVNTTTYELVASIPVGVSPNGVAISPDGSRAYIANQGDAKVTVINTATNAVIANIATKQGPTCMVLSPDGKTLYVTNSSFNYNLTVINTVTNAVTSNIAVGQDAFFLAINADGSRVYVANEGDNTISVINTATNTVLNTIQVQNSGGIVVSSDGTQLYVADYGNNDVNVISTLSNSLSASIPVGNGPNFIAISPDGSRLYVSNLKDNTVSVIDALTNNVIATINVGNTPAGMCFSADGTYIYVVDNGATINGAGKISVINTATNLVEATFDAGGSPLAYGNFIKPGAGCNGQPIQFTITVDPSSTSTDPVIIVPATVPALMTTYGTPSVSTQFTVSGNNLTAGVVAIAPTGFEVSVDGVNFSGSVIAGSAGNSSGVIYVRLTAVTPVGDYSGNIVLGSAGIADVYVAVGTSTVSPAQLTITADNKTRPYDTGNPFFTVTYSGFENNETAAILTAQPEITTTANAASQAGQYTITVSGAKARNYTITNVPGILTITSRDIPALLIPNTFSPNGDGINDTWDIKNIENYPNCSVDIYNRWGEKLYSSIGYPIPWDGRLKGNILPYGTYYYIINPKNNRTVIAGWVAIIK